MEISVERITPNMQGARRHFAWRPENFMGLLYSGVRYEDLDKLRCPWCGAIVPIPEPNHDHARLVRPEIYDGPRCEHGRADMPCTELYGADLCAKRDLRCGAIREFRAAELAQRFGAPAVVSWVRPCPRCRKAFAAAHKPLLGHELENVGRALHDDIKDARKRLERFYDDLRRLHEAFAELDDTTRVEPSPGKSLASRTSSDT